MKEKVTYSSAILEAFEFLLEKHPEVFVIGQGLWSPWYVGNTMLGLDKKFGLDRVMDCPVSEDGVTAIAVGASLCGSRAVVVHPRVDFMILAMNSIVNQAAKWGHMLGGGERPKVTIRGIVNRGGEQGAQHSQALHSWFAHIPGLRVVMPATPLDARDLLIAAVLCDDPVLYIDDRWCYEREEPWRPIEAAPLELIKPRTLKTGEHVTIVGAGYSSLLALDVAERLSKESVTSDVIDIRVINPFDPKLIIESVKKTGHLIVVDGSWKNCGLAGEVIASVVERVAPGALKSAPVRITLPHAPAPTSGPLEKDYYPDQNSIFETVRTHLSRWRS